MNSIPEIENTAADPFAADIFASETQMNGEDEQFERETTNAEPEKRILWSDSLPRAPRAAVRWDELERRLPRFFYGEMTSLLARTLGDFLDSTGEKTVEFVSNGKREMSRTDVVAPENLWWLTVGVSTAAADEIEIAFALEDAFAARLIDAAFPDSENQDEAIWRALTPTEIAVIEFFALNLIYEANRALRSPKFRLHRLSRKIPAVAQQTSFSSEDAPENSSLLVFEYRTAGTLLAPSAVQIYVAPEALEALQTNAEIDNRRIGRRDRFFAGNVRTRLICGDVQLTFGELAALEAGDVLFLENQNFSVQNGVLAGRAEVFLGDADNKRLSGNLFFSEGGATGGALRAVEENAADADGKIAVRPIDFRRSPMFAIENFAQTEISRFDDFMMDTNDELTNGFAASDAAAADEAGDEENGLAVENLAVALRVELDARRLTLAEVGGLRENQTLELGIRPTDEVNILIDERVVGRGELVAVEDRLGVRITKLMR